MTLNTSGMAFAHRFLPDRRIEFICMNCLELVCHVRHEQDAAAFLNAHVCEIETFHEKIPPQSDRLPTASETTAANDEP